MKTLFCVGLAAMTLPLVATIARVTAAEYPQVAQAAQRAADQSPASSASAEDSTAAQKEQAATIKANLAQLSEEDRELAAAQGYCAVMVKNPLGIMGPPVKVMVKDQPVFLCCEGCQRKALADANRTLATVENLKIKVAVAKLSPKDRRLAVAQGYCPVMRDNPLGAMGTPVKVMVGNEPVFLCCAGCKRRALANPSQTLAIVADLRTKVADEAARKAKAEARPTQR